MDAFNTICGGDGIAGMKVLAAVLVMIGGLSAPARSATVANDGSLASVVEAWSARQAKTDTFDFEWTASVFRTEARSVPNPALGPTPANQISYQSQKRFILDHSKRARYEGTEKVWNDDHQLVDQRLLEVFDGVKRSFSVPTGPVGFPALYISSKKRSRNSTNIHARPLVLVYRTLDPSLAILEAARLSEFNGHNYQELLDSAEQDVRANK